MKFDAIKINKERGLVTIQAMADDGNYPSSDDFPSIMEQMRAGINIPNLAVEYAAKNGFAQPRISPGNRQPYPYYGDDNEEPEKILTANPGAQPLTYRVDIRVVAKIL